MNGVPAAADAATANGADLFSAVSVGRVSQVIVDQIRALIPEMSDEECAGIDVGADTVLVLTDRDGDRAESALVLQIRDAHAIYLRDVKAIGQR